MPYSVVTAVWTGAAGLPGYSKLKFNGQLTSTEATEACNKTRAFFAALTTYLPVAIHVKVQQVLDIYDDEGQKTGLVTATSDPADVVGVAAGAYNQAAGAWINWRTNVFANGSRVTGRTFLVPTASVAFQSDGTLLGSFVIALQAAGDALRTGSPTLVIPYHRFLKDGTEVFGVPPVAAVSVTDKGGVLRSRRD
jgi:hypothetical protein